MNIKLCFQFGNKQSGVDLGKVNKKTVLCILCRSLKHLFNHFYVSDTILRAFN